LSKFIDVPIFDGGYVSQGDMEDIPKDACSLTKNFEIDKPGMIYKRRGQKLITTKASRQYSQIMKWVNAQFDASGFDGTAWICFDTVDDKIYYYDRNWGNETEVKDLVSGVADIKIINFVDKLRFANGLTKKVGVLQNIDRDFFWNSAIKTVDLFDYDDAAPQDGDQSYTLTLTDEGIGTGGTLLDASTYYYKIVPLFDGVQEAPLPDRFVSLSPAADNSTLILDVVFSTVNTAWNERITGYNIYRATASGGPYYLILSVSTLDTNDVNLTYQAGALVGYGLYVPDKAWTDQSSKYVLIKSILYDISSNTTDVMTFVEQIPDGYEIWGGAWYRITSNIFVANCGSDFEVNDTTGWTQNDCTMTIPAANPYQGTRAADILMDAAAVQSSIESPTFTAIGGEEYFISVAVKKDANVDNVKVYVKDDVGAYTLLGTSTSLTYEVISGTFTSDGGATSLQIKIEVNDAGANQESGYCDNLYVGALEDSGTTDGYAGINTIIDDDFSLDRESALEHWRVLVGTNTDGNNDASSEIRRITNNVEKAIRVDSDFTGSYIGNNQKMYLCKNYLWQLTGTNQVTLKVYDTNIVAGRLHPTGDDIIAVNYEFGEYIDGFMYGFSVRLDPDGAAEDHKNWLIFSEFLQPDVMPIDNYIELRDIQGGAAMGSAQLRGDLIALMEHGIYRLHIPTGDPASWSLAEVDETKGCVAKNSVLTVKGVTFFAGSDYFHAILPNFEVIDISETIKDEYQAKENLVNTRVTLDNKMNRLNCRFGDDTENLYCLDLKAFFKERREKWNVHTHTEIPVDMLMIDENLDVYASNRDITTTFGTEKDFGADYGRVDAMCVYDGKLWAGIIDGTNKDIEVWSYDGSTWTEETNRGYVGGNQLIVTDMVVYNNKLYVAIFESPDVNEHILEYDKDTDTWSVSKDFGTSTLNGCLCLQVYKDKLYAGINVDVTGANTTQVWVFDGSTWSEEKDWGSGFRGVYSLVVYNDKLLAGLGNLTDDGVIWQYDGSTWSLFKAFTTGVTTQIDQMIVFRDDLYVQLAETGTNAYSVQKYDGSTWSEVKDLTGLQIYHWAVHNNILYYGGFDHDVSGEGDDLFYFDGTTWGTYKAGLGAIYNAIEWIAVYQGNLFLGMKGVVNGDGHVLGSTLENNIYKLYSDGGSESLEAVRRTGWFPISHLDRDEIIRRVNARYYSEDAITVRVYANGKNGSTADAVWSGTLTANRLTGDRYLSLRPGGCRANFAMVEVALARSANYECDLERLQLEVDD